MYTTLIAPAELEPRLADPALVVVDARHELARPEWGESQYRAAHIPGAVFAHLDRDLSGEKTGRNGRHPLPSPAQAAAVFGRLGIDATKQVVVYDQNNGAFGSRLWWMLRWLGHNAVAVLDGGYERWLREGRPTTAQLPPPRAAQFVVRETRAAVDVRVVEASLADRSLLVVDARAPERYRGEVEPLDPVAGHIPGAINRPYAQNLTAEGNFKSPSVLRAEFDALLAGRPLTQVVNQCGSGVTACHNLLALEVAGLPGSLLYPGSWSEWSADPARPVARG